MASIVIFKIHKTPNYAAVEAALEKLAGVVTAKANYVTGTITVTFDQSKLTIDEIESEIREKEQM